MARQFRKAKRRPSREHQDALADEKRDADLDELWEVLAETRGSNSWHIPWRNGANVVELCLLVHRALEPASNAFLEEVEFLRKFYDSDDWQGSQVAYWQLQETITTLGNDARFLVAAARAAQLLISNSHGGGQVYNDLLVTRWEYAPAGSDLIMRDVRCKDALGIDWRFDSSKRDRLRRAFFTAWSRGLYQVAYAVGG